MVAGVAAPRSTRRFSLTGLKAGFSYPLRAGRLGRGLLLPAGLVLLSLAWGQADHYLYYAALPWSQQASSLEYWKRPSVAQTMRWLASPGWVWYAPYWGVAHMPQGSLYSLARTRWGSASTGVALMSDLFFWTPRWPWLRGNTTAAIAYVAYAAWWAGQGLPGVLLTCFLTTLLVVLLLRAVRDPPTTTVPVLPNIAARGVALLFVWICLWVACLPVYYVRAAGGPSWAKWLLWAWGWAGSVVLLLCPYTIIGAGLGVEAGVRASLRLLWRHPLEVTVIVVTCGLFRSVARLLESRNTFTLWLEAGSRPTRQVVLGTLADMSLLIIPALIITWTMAAFLLFVLDHAREAAGATSGPQSPFPRNDAQS